MIRTDEAARLKVNGWDVFLSEHIAYVSSANQDWMAGQLCSQGLLFARDTAMLSLREQRKLEAERWRQYLNQGGLLGRDPHPDSSVGLHQLQHWRLDCFKLGTALELALKARLLRSGHVLHLIASSQQQLATKQRTRPVLISEFRSVASSYHDGTRNFFPDLTDRTLSFETMLKKEAYLQALSLPEEHKQFFDELRRLRNLVHLPLVGEQVATPLLSSLGEDFLPFLLGCLNVYLVAPHNETCLPGQSEPAFSSQ
jgi:hypothetical protein